MKRAIGHKDVKKNILVLEKAALFQIDFELKSNYYKNLVSIFCSVMANREVRVTVTQLPHD